VDVEAEMQGLLDAVTDAALTDPAQVRILEVASLAKITPALRADQYHVLHLFGHGSPGGIELEDEDGNPVFATTDQLLDALRAGGHALPLVVLASCSGAASGTTGLVAALVRHGADRALGMLAAITDTYATGLGHRFYTALVTHPDLSVAAALALARRDLEQEQAAARGRGERLRPEAAIPTLLAAGSDPPLRDPRSPAVPLQIARPPAEWGCGSYRSEH
jgi:CHAT domain-containing protein